MSWRAVRLLAAKELRETLNSPMPYIFLAAFFLIQGWFFAAPLFLTQAMLPALGGGAVVNIADVIAERPVTGLAHYAATKTMQLSVSRSLAELTKGTAVTVRSTPSTR